MKYGYARVSTRGQNLEAQLRALREAGSERIFKEMQSGRKTANRDQFKELLDTATEGDTIIVTKLDRFARSTKDALSTVELLNNKGVGLVVLNMGGDKVDTSTAIGKLMITVLSGIAEFEADMIMERQLEGIELAKQRGAYKGRPKKFTQKNSSLKHALELYNNRDSNGKTVKEICEITGVGRSTLYNVIKETESGELQ
ncbi:recombinase family protein [Rossellomorea marisflavi]|uniref:recombinase family protein n=1 Tax=Rossellomorea marisflavi TaxID=189381 RepID=UPI00203AB414|nr:recombinase family protein [Rossellomorea marisflavi]MCM2590488.1 recombinase family protein [Rossellomorea marisflavi]